MAQRMKKKGKPEREERTDKDQASRLEDMAQALYGIASGDFSVSLDTSLRQDELDTVALGISMLAEEIGALVEGSRAKSDFTDNIIRSLADSLVLVDPEANIKTVNRETCELLGYSEDELIGKPVSMLFAEEEEEEEVVFKKAVLKKLIDAGTIKNYEVTYRTRKGEEIPVLLNGSVMRDEDGKIIGVLCIARDITERKRAEEGLKKSEFKYRLLTENMNDMVWTTDLEMNAIYVSPSVEELLGFAPEEYIELPVHVKVAPESLKLSVDRLTEELIHDRERDSARSAVLVLGFYHKDGSVKSMETSLTLIRDESGIPVGLYGLSRDITERKRAEDEIRRLSKRIMDEHEESRRRMAADLHDEVSQSLHALKIEMDMFAMEAGTGQAERLEGMGGLLEDVISTVRSLSGELRPPLLDDFGLEKALEVYIEEFSGGAGVAASMECSGVPLTLPKDLGLSLYRITQEALANVQRHADAREVRVSLTNEDGFLTLVVKDDGRGFDLERALRGNTPGPHFGILGMRERANMVKGSLEISSRPGNGTTVTVNVPFSTMSPEHG